MKVLIFFFLIVSVLLLVSCGGIDYEAMIHQELDNSGIDWQSLFFDVRVDGLNSVFMCNADTSLEIIKNPLSASEIASLCLDITVVATKNTPGGPLTRADLIAINGQWLADADLKTSSGKIVIENYIAMGQIMTYPDYKKVFGLK